MDVDFDFSDVDSFFDEGEWEVEKKMIDVGDEAVKYAEEHGDYQDHTLTLRTSNDYDVNKDGLTLKNEAEYASFVESKGYDVLSSAALFAEKRLKEEFEKYAKDNNVNSEFLGRLDYEEMVGYLCACNIAVNPISKGAAQSIINKVGDYAAAGLPVINTQESVEYRKLVEDYQIGFNLSLIHISEPTRH